MIKRFVTATLIFVLLAPCLTADTYEYVQMARVAQQQERGQRILSARAKRRWITGTVVVGTAATVCGVLAYQYKNKTGLFAQNQPLDMPVEITGPVLEPGVVQAHVVHDFMQQQRERYTVTGMLKDGVINGLVAALVAFILDRARDTSSITPSFFEAIFPWDDTPVLLNGIQKMSLVMRRYERIVLEHLQQQVVLLPPLVNEAIERNKTFEHFILVQQFEQLFGLVLAMAPDAKRVEVTRSFMPLIEAMNQLANSYTDASLQLADREALLIALRFQLEQWIGVVMPLINPGATDAA